MREIRYLDATRQELSAAITWYQSHQTTGVAEQILEIFSESILQIAELPDAWPVSKLDARVRVRFLRSIRYAIFYVADVESVTIIAVAHTRRRPGYWLDRLR